MKKKKGIVILTIFLILFCVVVYAFLLYRNSYVSDNVVEKSEIENTEDSLLNNSSDNKSNKNISVLQTKEGTMVKKDENEYYEFKTNLVDGKNVISLLYNGYVFKEDIDAFKVNYSDSKNALYIQDKENTWISLLLIKEGTYNSRLKRFDELNASVEKARKCYY